MSSELFPFPPFLCLQVLQIQGSVVLAAGLLVVLLPRNQLLEEILPLPLKLD
jgi:hypothetical protein